jgi:hypothetical protein
MDTAPPILPPTNDWVFKLLFGDERHKENTVALDAVSEREAEGGF